MAKKIVYSEPVDYFPKSIRLKVFGISEEKKKNAAKKTEEKEKVKRKRFWR